MIRRDGQDGRLVWAPEQTRPDGMVRAPVNLRGDVSIYLSSFQVETKHGTIAPIEREGHRYAFSHTLATGGYRPTDAAGPQDLYIFVELNN